jgi:hypothetical protein
MATINPQLMAQFETQPEQPVDLIVRTEGDAAPRLAWFSRAGVDVKRQFRLTPGVAITCTGATALKLLLQDWVVSIEPDQTITTM